MEYLTRFCSTCPMGDDTPIWLYALIGVLALVLLVVMTVLSKKSKKK